MSVNKTIDLLEKDKAEEEKISGDFIDLKYGIQSEKFLKQLKPDLVFIITADKYNQTFDKK